MLQVFFDESKFPEQVKILLERKHLVPTGVNVGGDCGRMRTFGVKLTRWYDLKQMAKVINPFFFKLQYEALSN